MTARLRITSRLLATGIALLVIAAIATTIAPTRADAALACFPVPIGAGSDNQACWNGGIYHTDRPTFKGWATVVLPYNDPRTTCKAMDPICGPYVRSYSWNGAWKTSPYTDLRAGTRVYAWPYGSGWSWVWTQQRGWQAVQSKYVLIAERAPFVGTCNQFACTN